jgi:hypothetical protein
MSKAIEVKNVSQLLLDDPELMRRWKAASQAGKLEAVTVKGRNVTVIHDEALLEYLRETYSEIQIEELEPDPADLPN